MPDNVSKSVDIYRYYNGTDYLFTANPQSETKRLIQNNYVKEGIAFRLFNPDTPGTPLSIAGIIRKAKVISIIMILREGEKTCGDIYMKAHRQHCDIKTDQYQRTLPLV